MITRITCRSAILRSCLQQITRPASEKLVLPISTLRMERRSTTSIANSAVHFAAGYPVEQGMSDLATLVSPAGPWILTSDGKGIERMFRFAGFRKTWEFMNLIAAEAIVRNHHPEWSNVYNITYIKWTTHNPAGLSENDIKMARFSDNKAKELGELGNDERSFDSTKSLVERLASLKKSST